ncbi:PEP-CTERM sorting domain-containing protein [Aliiglaciecola sp. 2_MG-2023]|uniref:PEP-CTERM sorting domain-containing protein n=1 Tax=unclassified Aliiglaciecola TaxID=2593648 RepID=UPI0026E40DFF|nr:MULTISPECIES: PEP-CTERM sorting domain-containing protein [unclassified Aliiglaciecola]MDO6712199.1 PEP-CTERM sorting domain-containing protein [Aliiglaciecola sp. 2_MG-2023]MDO6753563.1 PEP-CTERM sorting domain-containing protein [Aliiglaciecola sp. 1_MG-2023]
MKTSLGLSILCGVSMLFASVSANASLLTFNGQSINALDLDGVSSSFEEFYDYRMVSANTGLEVVDTVVMYVAELAGEYAIFTTANKFGSGGVNGNLSVDITATSGAVTFTDDPKEMPSAFEMMFQWAGNLTDGYIYSGMDSVFTFSAAMSSLKGINGVQFVDFLDGSFDSASYSNVMDIDGDFVISASASDSASAVPEPSIILLLSLGLLSLFRRKVRS